MPGGDRYGIVRLQSATVPRIDPIHVQCSLTLGAGNNEPGVRFGAQPEAADLKIGFR
jgi:hypothetical protein